MELHTLPGACLVVAGSRRILFGTFPEVHQHLMQRGLGWPDTLVFTDAIVRDRLPQMVPEFLFFGHVFFNQNFDWVNRCVKQPLTFVGTERQVSRASTIMDISFLGLTSDVRGYGLEPERAAMLERECDYFALKDARNEVIPTSAFLDLRSWDEDDSLTLDDVQIVRTGLLTYTISHGEQVLALDLRECEQQGPTWHLPEIRTLVPNPQNTLRILGSAGAFQHVAPSTSYLLTVHGDHYLIDTSPYVHRTLAHLGIAIEQVRGIFISHVHDDHTGDILAFAGAKRRLTLYTTREVRAGLVHKLAALLDVPVAEAERRFDFQEIVPGVPMHLGGARLDFHDACHAVPCVGMSVTLGGDTVVITSDTAGHRQLLDMHQRGLISDARLAMLEALLQGQQVIVDAGEAIIHGYIEDFLHLADPSNLVLAHRHTLPEQYREAFRLAHPLQTFEFGRQDESALDAVAIGRALQSWGVRDLWAWTSEFAAHRTVHTPEPGEAILREGDHTQDAPYFYVITHGECEVTRDGQALTRLRSGDLFGEWGFFCDGRKRIASVRTSTPSRILALPGATLLTMVQEEDRLADAAGEERLSDRLRRLWEHRAIVERTPMFAGLDVDTLNRVSLRVTRVEVPAEEVIVQEGQQDDAACYVVLQGRLRVEKPESPILERADVFGEAYAGGLTPSRTATVRSLEPCTLLKITRDDLVAFRESHPHVERAIRALASRRRYLDAV
ncbi:MAG: cyclic nucleotide-binding domain-containing protein [bacterium]|nr:cyclic nucleotide-binding domain-containing protein [bacterium]